MSGLEQSQYLYRETLGSLMYLMIGTRPDFKLAAENLAQFGDSPRPVHLNAVKRVMRYVKETSGTGICYSGVGELGICGFCGYDWAGNTKNQRVTSEDLFMINHRAISWCSLEQSDVPPSTCDSEHKSLNAAWKKLFGFIAGLRGYTQL